MCLHLRNRRHEEPAVDIVDLENACLVSVVNVFVPLVLQDAVLEAPAL